MSWYYTLVSLKNENLKARTEIIKERRVITKLTKPWVKETKVETHEWKELKFGIDFLDFCLKMDEVMREMRRVFETKERRVDDSEEVERFQIKSKKEYKNAPFDLGA